MKTITLEAGPALPNFFAAHERGEITIRNLDRPDLRACWEEWKKQTQGDH